MRKNILLLGIFSVLGTVIMGTCDYLLLGHPISGKQYYDSGLTYILNIPSWRLFYGGIMAVFFLPLGLLGFWQMHIGIKRAGPFLSTLFLVFAVYSMIIGTLLHILYPVYGEVIRTVSIIGPYANQYILLLLGIIGRYHGIFLTASYILQIILGFMFIYIIILKQTDYPKWMVIGAPGLLSFFFMLAGMFLPAPYGGFISATFVHCGYFFTFVLSTLILYAKYGKNDNAQ